MYKPKKASFLKSVRWQIRSKGHIFRLFNFAELKHSFTENGEKHDTREISNGGGIFRLSLKRNILENFRNRITTATRTAILLIFY